MSGQDDAIPLQAVKSNDTQCVFEPNVIRIIINENLFVYIKFYNYYYC